MSGRAGRLPDFVCIGAVRAGTTWLWENLRGHPRVWLPPEKEINFFNRLHPILGDEPAAETVGDGATRPGATGGERPRLLRDRLRHLKPDRVGRYLRRLRPAELAWQLRFYGKAPSEAWYRSLFASAGGRLAGDITPHYSALPAAGARYAAELLSEAKFILILRDPVARAWSHAVFDLTRYGRRPVGTISAEDFRAHFHNPHARVRGDYVRMLDLWQGLLPPDRLRIAFFDDIGRRPGEFLRETLLFLGAGDAPYTPPKAEEKVNASVKASLPAELRRELAGIYLSDLEALSVRLGGPAVGWLERARAALAGS